MSTSLNIAVIGSREFNDYSLLESTLNEYNINQIISGGAKGADSLAETYAEAYNIPTTIFLPDWNKYGRSAAFIRNKDIVEASQLVIAFWDGTSRGTEHSIKHAYKLSIPVVIKQY